MTTTPSARATRSRWPTASSRRRWPSGSSTSARRPSTSSTTSSSRTTWCSWTSASRWCARRTRSVWEKAERTEAPGANIHGYRTVGDIMRVLQPVHGRDVPRGAAHEPHRAGDDLPDGGAPRAPLDDLPGRRGHGGHADAADRLPQPAAALPGLHQEGRRHERRRLRLLLRGPAGLRGGRAAAHPARLLGRVQQPRPRRLPLRHDERLGQRDVRHPGRRRRRRAGDDEPRRHQPRHPDPARQLVLRGLDERGDVRPDRPARQPGRQAPPVEPDDDPQAAEARPRRRQLLVGHEPALVRQAHGRQPGARHRRRRARAAVGHGAGQQGRHAVRQGDRAERPDEPAQDAGHARGRPRVEDPAVVERDRARPRADLLRGLRGRAWRCTSSTAPSRRSAPGARRSSRTSTSPTRRSAAASTRRCAACCRTTS